MAGASDQGFGAGPASTRAAAETRPPPDRNDEFLVMLAHEFRNPLAPIRSAVEIMRMIGQKDPAMEKAREMISRQVDQLSRLVDQLLDVTRLHGESTVLDKAPVEINSLLTRSVEAVQPVLEERNHTLTVSLLAQPLTVEAEARRLEQVFTNLLDNAARYTESGGEIVLSVVRDKRTVSISVKDNGIGIPAEALPRIFDLFAQHRRGERPPAGLGIGLTLVRQLVELHGGTVEARSAGEQSGAEFIVHLPLVRDTARAAPPLKPPGGRDMPRRIVVIDDNVDAAESLAMLLRLKGHEVHIAFDGPSGVETALKTAPDCVLVDIGLPGIDGFEVAKRLRAQDSDGMLLVALTGYGQAEDRAKSERAGFDHHLVKPVSQTVLENLLRER